MTKESLDKFKEIYKRIYKVDLTDEQALDLASNLLNLYRAIYAEYLNININQNEKEIQLTQNQN